jgi:endonuclease/exonuclease/phosphatase family metal-dependent hydrolase
MTSLGQDYTTKFATLNIRWDSPNDGKNIWQNRRQDVANFLSFHAPDVMGFQEAMPHQIAYLDSALYSYSWVGESRDGGMKLGEACPIFYKKVDFELLDSGTFWLTDSVGSKQKSWDADFPRICTYAILKRKDIGKIIAVFNTHFDHVGVIARKESAILIAKKSKELAKGASIVLMGDLNSEPDKEAIFTLKQNGFNDAYEVAMKVYGSIGTFNGFNTIEPPTRRIDYIFVSPDIRVMNYGVSSDLIENRYISDHFPVMAIVQFTK